MGIYPEKIERWIPEFSKQLRHISQILKEPQAMQQNPASAGSHHSKAYRIAD
jgi:hypothetical protein